MVHLIVDLLNFYMVLDKKIEIRCEKVIMGALVCFPSKLVVVVVSSLNHCDLPFQIIIFFSPNSQATE